jgi:hypothetical protein
MCCLEERNPKRARGTKCALGAQAGDVSPSPHSVFRRDRQAAPRLTRSGAASVDQTPHSPQLKIRRSVRPPLRGMVRVRCIDRPQFGGIAAGRCRGRRPAALVPVTPTWYSLRCISNERMKFKRTFETRTGRKQGIFVIFPARLHDRHLRTGRGETRSSRR